jgi:amino acid transporter
MKLGLKEALATVIGLVMTASGMLIVSQGFGMGGGVFVIALVLAWFLMMCQATSFAEFSSVLPTAGAVYDYITAGMGRFWGMTVTLAAYVVVTIFAGTAEAAAAGIFAKANYSFLAGVPQEYTWTISWAVLLFTMIINIIGVEVYAMTENVLAALKWATVLFLGILGVFMAPQVPLEAAFGVSHIGTSFETVLSLVGLAMFLFVGAEYITPLAPEMKRPERDIPRALYWGLTLILIALFFYGWGILRQVPNDVVNAGGTHFLETPQSPSAYGAAVLGGFGNHLMSIAIFLASIATLNTIIATIPRILMGMAQDNMLPAFFGKVHPRFKTPYMSILFVGIIPMIGTVIVQGDINGMVAFILAAMCSWIFCYFMINISLIRLRMRRPDLTRPYSVPFYPFPQIFALLGLMITFWYITPPHLSRLSIYIPFVVMLSICAAFALIWITQILNTNPWQPIEPEIIMGETRSEHIRVHQKEK